jgi:hypothetical protein
MSQVSIKHLLTVTSSGSPIAAALRRAAAVGLLLLLAGCASETRTPPTVDRPAPKNFSGSWEMNYGRSETANAKVRAMYEELQRRMEQQARVPRRDPYYRGPSVSVGANAGSSIKAILPLARMAEMITSSSVVEIKQDDKTIGLVRNDNFTLECDFFKAKKDKDEPNLLGNERCGWDGQDLIFHIDLPEKLDIVHRLTMAADKSELRIATTVSSGDRQFTLNKYFYQFEAMAPDYDCQFTLTRGNVCSRAEQ